MGLDLLLLVLSAYWLKKAYRRHALVCRSRLKVAAFTIIELLVVIAVISILIGVAVPRMKGMQDQANLTKVKGELNTLQSAIESYYINQDPDSYPSPTNATNLCSTVLNDANPLIVASPLYDPFYSASGGCAADVAQREVVVGRVRGHAHHHSRAVGGVHE